MHLCIREGHSFQKLRASAWLADVQLTAEKAGSPGSRQEIGQGHLKTSPLLFQALVPNSKMEAVEFNKYA